MLQDVIITYITSQDCGYCHQFRGDGILGNGKEYMSFDKLHALLHDGVTFLNIHSRIRDGKIDNITDISKFWVKTPTPVERKEGINEKIIQEKCFKFEDKVRVLLLELEIETPVEQEQKFPYETKKARAIETYTVKKNKSDDFVRWDDWVINQVPQKIENYTGVYAPQVIVIKKKDWSKSLKDGSPFHAMTDRSRIVKTGDDWGIARDGRLVQKIGTDIGAMMQELRKGTFKFEAIEEKTTPDPGTSTSGKKPRPETSSKKQVPTGGRYIYYDDPE